MSKNIKLRYNYLESQAGKHDTSVSVYLSAASILLGCKKWKFAIFGFWHECLFCFLFF